MKCAIRCRRDYYCVSTVDRRQSNFPSWKLTSKNQKQWMWKKCRIKESKNSNGWNFKDIVW